jgi:hypothetical protein
MTAAEVFNQNNGDVTRAYYAEMNAKGLPGQLAVALFRAQKRSAAAKKYRGGGFRREAYDVKNWSLSEIVRICMAIDANWPGPECINGRVWGWQGLVSPNIRSGSAPLRSATKSSQASLSSATGHLAAGPG